MYYEMSFFFMKALYITTDYPVIAKKSNYHCLPSTKKFQKFSFEICKYKTTLLKPTEKFHFEKKNVFTLCNHP